MVTSFIDGSGVYGSDMKRANWLRSFKNGKLKLSEGNVLRMGRTKMVRVRIRQGKVQRRRRLSSVKGYTIRGGKMIRMSPMERRNRKMGARRSKFKRRAKLRQSLRKRKMSLRRRTAMGL
jgi:hypothetical protein